MMVCGCGDGVVIAWENGTFIQIVIQNAHNIHVHVT